jgi:hypothetical protein
MDVSRIKFSLLSVETTLSRKYMLSHKQLQAHTFAHPPQVIKKELRERTENLSTERGKREREASVVCDECMWRKCS